MLSVKNLSMQFGGIKALQDINFNINSQSLTAIIGPNGAGKTTLFNCITGFYKPTSGDIFLNNHSLLHRTHVIARQGIARTFQNIRLFREMTVMENCLVAQNRFLNKNLIAGLLNTKDYRQKLDQAVEYAYTWLKHLDIESYANQLAGFLSYGIQRKVEIARALCTRPLILCLDEPAAGLNPTETAQLAHYIRALKEHYQITVLLIEHDMHFIMNLCEHIIVLDHGVLIAEGSPQEIQNNPAVITAYLGLPHAGI